MQRQFETVLMSDPVSLAAQKMRERRLDFLPVVDEAQRPVGIVTAAEIDGRRSRRVGEVMRTEWASCDERDHIESAAVAMLQAGVEWLMCLDREGRLSGLVRLSDLTRPPLAAPRPS
jgi:CBS domain-containing protein